MEIIVNGEKQQLEGPVTVSRLLNLLGIDPRSVAVERNLQIVARSDMESEIVEEGDNLEIIRMVGGG